jgi:hypothetical protein
MRLVTPTHVHVLLTFVLLVPLGCGGAGEPTGSTCPSGSTLTYENFGQSFFASNCNRCHGNAEIPHFSTQQQIQSVIDQIDRTAAAGPAATNTSMPEDTDLPETDRRKLGEWLACGAP